MIEVKKIKKEHRFASVPIVTLHLFLLAMLVLLLLLPADLLSKGPLGAVLAKARIVNSFFPTFDFNLTDQIVNQTSHFYLDVNCSDLDAGDVITYRDNFTGFVIDPVTGIINQSGFDEQFLGNYTINITCSDSYGLNTSQSFVLTILEANNPPVLAPIGNQLLVHGENFVLDVDATDPENSVLTYGAITSLFTIDPLTGLINFTPTIGQVGNHTINITVFDGELYDHELVLFIILLGPYCGDTSCGNGESCVTCQQDCGTCPPTTGGGESQPGGESGQGGDSASGDFTSVPQQSPAPYYRCDENWECTPWNVCTLQGSHTRKCKDLNRCGATTKKPRELEECEYVPTCEDNIQNGGETDIDCGGPCKPCIIESCFDGIRNQGEEGVDCGNPCEKTCEEALQARVPALEIAGLIELPRKFPWLFLLIIALILSIALIADRIYLRSLMKNKLDEYARKRKEYAPWRRKMFKAMLSTIIISLITSAYLYYFSNDYEGMLKYVWILLIIIAIVPFIVSLAIQKYRYNEYNKMRKEQRLKQTHRRELLHLIKIENDFLKDMEKKSNSEMYEQTKNHIFDNIPSLYASFSVFYNVCTTIIKKRKERLGELDIDEESLTIISSLLKNSALLRYAKDYPEFYSLLNVLKSLKENQHTDLTDREQELLDEIEEISKPHLRAVVLSNPQLVEVYNTFVDLYETYQKKKQKLALTDKELQELERSFTDKVKDLSKKTEDMQVIAKNSPMALLYNNMVRLFNHYTKKQQLRKAIENM